MARVLQSRSANHYTYMYMYTCLASGLLLSSLCVVKAIYVCQLADISPEASAPMVLFLELASHICNRLFAMYMYVVTILSLVNHELPIVEIIAILHL